MEAGVRRLGGWGGGEGVCGVDVREVRVRERCGWWMRLLGGFGRKGSMGMCFGEMVGWWLFEVWEVLWVVEGGGRLCVVPRSGELPVLLICM